jgi:N-sulfoglucosamine sulfohydrolase
MSNSERPNVLLLLCHDFGEYMGCYGHNTVNTPNLDKLATEGVRFTRSFCTAPQCSPSRSALHSGRYPHANGIVGLTHAGFACRYNEGERHVAQILSDGGYDTHLFGIQHVTNEPVSTIGFNHNYLAARPAAELEKATCYWLTERSAGADSEPWYAQVGFHEPHRVFDFGDVEPDESLGVYVPGWLPDTEAVRQDLAAFQGAAKEVDRAIGGILAALDESGMAENTLVIFTVDHGIAFPRAKCTLYDPGINVALMMRQPGVTDVGVEIEHMVSNVDVLPTLLDLVGIEKSDNLQGRSFAPLLVGGEYEPRSEVFAEKTYHTYYDPMRCIRTDRYKLICNFEFAPEVEFPTDMIHGLSGRTILDYPDYHPPTELYDLDLDPLEQTNLSGDPAYGVVEANLRARLAAWMRSTDDPLLDGPIPSGGFTDRMTEFRRSTLDA